ncbi:MAG: hypothetical protein OXG26_19300 [Caldilineaceae bacterium]|nr:hypothetical protein [Caldilineaceae bacterium]
MGALLHYPNLELHLSKKRESQVQSLYGINEEETLSVPGEKGVLITADEVSTIEFWDYSPEEKNYAKA